jgi:aerobic-type carbon monoxide dehydrogenase small subunit (CoxS/CutS family)
MSQQVELSTTVNGREVEDRIDPRTLLIDYLRDDLGLTGGHLGCDDGVCGACTVDLDGRPVKSCLLFLPQVNGRHVTTIEAVGDGEPDGMSPLQKCFVEHGAIQCGYCTPGMVMAARALLDRCPQPTEADVRRGMVGNLCRCGGYQRIVAAVLTAAEGDGPGDVGDALVEIEEVAHVEV